MERSCFSPTGRRGSSKEDVQHTECGAVAELCRLDTDVSGTKVKWVLSVLSVGRTDYSEVGTELCLKSSGMVWYIPWCLGNASDPLYRQETCQESLVLAQPAVCNRFSRHLHACQRGLGNNGACEG